MTIDLSSSDTDGRDGRPASLTFTAGNWNVAQTVTVTGVDDALVDGDVTYTIVTRGDERRPDLHTAINAADVTVTNTDNDAAGDHGDADDRADDDRSGRHGDLHGGADHAADGRRDDRR